MSYSKWQWPLKHDHLILLPTKNDNGGPAVHFWKNERKSAFDPTPCFLIPILICYLLSAIPLSVVRLCVPPQSKRTIYDFMICILNDGLEMFRFWIPRWRFSRHRFAQHVHFSVISPDMQIVCFLFYVPHAAAAVVQWVRALASHAEGWVFES